jgi:hypothetical protein
VDAETEAHLAACRQSTILNGDTSLDLERSGYRAGRVRKHGEKLISHERSQGPAVVNGHPVDHASEDLQRVVRLDFVVRRQAAVAHDVTVERGPFVSDVHRFAIFNHVGSASIV